MTSVSTAAGTLAARRPREEVHAKAVQLVRLALDMTAEAGSGHPTSAASLAHLVTVLLYGHMRWDPSRPDHPASDRLVLSEGHACPIVYAAAADLGVAVGRDGRHAMTRADALTLRELGSPIEGHPQPATGFTFFPAATGSLGQGLSVSAGLALAARLDGLSRRIFCLIGDGESREGQVWEALDFLLDHRLTAVCPIFNANGQGQTGPVSSQQSPDVLARKLEAFGFDPVLLDGHDPDAIAAALALHASTAERGSGQPVALVARTVKGWGMPSLSRQVAGRHGQPVRGAELEQARTELDRTAAMLGARDGGDALHPSQLPDEQPSPRPRATDTALPGLREALARHGDEALLDKGKLATRKAYGIALRALGEARPDVVVLDGDVSNSTFAETFAHEPALAERFFECRIAEQNMVSCAAGLAAGGKVPFASSFGKFLGRTYDQMEMAVLGGQAVRLVGSHVGVTPAADGPSQMALADAAWFAALARVRRDGRPLLHVLTPCDAWSAYALTLAMAADERSSYLRTLRPDTPLLYGPHDGFRLGGHGILRRGGDLLIAAWGYMVHVALQAAGELADAGISATVVDLYSLPFEAEAFADIARGCRWRVLTLEDNDGGALGAAVAEVLASTGAAFTHRELFVRGVPRSGRAEGDVLADLGLSAAHVVEAARALARG